MTFLQPMLLAALPIIALPIVIHLINQRRYQTIRWGAMMFLLSANRMSRGYARIRQWLIMAFRMLALAGLIFSISRPLASGWLGMAAGGRADTTIVILDRSPSMRQQRPGTAGSKLETGRRQLASTLGTFSSSLWVLIDSTSGAPRELESPDELLRVAAAEPTSASADLPALLQAARDYIQRNRPGRTEIWICSDLRENDWLANDARWQGLRDSFAELPQGVRFHLLAYPEPASDNVSVRVTDIRRRQSADSAELLVSLRIARDIDDSQSANDRRVAVPIQFEIDGARSELTVELTGRVYELKDHSISLDKNKQRGWGRVSIPVDANLADNDFYFVFDQPVVRQAVIVTDEAQAAAPLQLAASISPDPAIRCAAEVMNPRQLQSLAWDTTSLILWHAPLPTGSDAEAMQSYLHRGGNVIFFPPRAPGGESFAGVSWKNWTELKDDVAVATWRGDQDLLANTQSGAALPIGQLQIRRYCSLAGDHTPLAELKVKASLLARATTPRGGVYFLATTPAASDSNLASGGIVLYALVQRALAAGSAVLGNARQIAAGDPAVIKAEQTQNWRQVAGPRDALSTEYAFNAGVYGQDDKLFAINATSAEDHAPVLKEAKVSELFAGLDFARVDDQAGNLASLINEIWRPFLAAMILALIVEAVLCLPKITPTAGAPAGATA